MFSSLYSYYKFRIPGRLFLQVVYSQWLRLRLSTLMAPVTMPGRIHRMTVTCLVCTLMLQRRPFLHQPAQST